MKEFQIMTMKKKKTFVDIIVYILLLVGASTMVLPFFWMISSSLKYEKDIFTYPIKWIPENPLWNNYVEVFDRAPFGLFYFNTFKIAIITTILLVLTSSLCAYAFSKLEFPGRDKFFIGYLATMMVPFQVIMIPQFIIIRKLGLSDTHMALILIGMFNPFGVFLLRQFYMGVPESLSESARIDGENEFGIYWKIVLPLSKPALASLSIFTFVTMWNQFTEPLIYLTSKSKKVIQLGMRLFQTEYGTEYSLIMACATISVFPMIIIYLIAQKYFIEGITLSGLKG